MKKCIFLLINIFLILFFSCLTIERPRDFLSEKSDRQLEYKFKSNIFEEYIWTEPPVFGKEFKLNKNIYEFSFKGKKYILTKNNDNSFSITDSDNKVVSSNVYRSNGDCYYNIDKLKTRNASVKKQVAKTRYVTQMIPITHYTPVRMGNQTIMQSYTTYSTRVIPQTYFAWETVEEEVLDIPEYKYFDFMLDAYKIRIYQIKEKDEFKYYFQNISYFEAVDILDESSGDKNFKILIIDSNSNGSYNDDEDRVFFNSWNPYDKKSRYQVLPEYLDNYWYRQRELRVKKFITFIPDEKEGKLFIRNVNSEYIGSKDKGELIVTNIPFKTTDIYINNEIFFQNRKGVLKREIEYGIHRMIIKMENRVDFEKIFLINEQNPVIEFRYSETPEAGKLNFENDYLKDWTIIINDNNGDSKYYYNRKELNLAPGEYNVTVSSGGFNLNKKVVIKKGEEITINYNNEIERLSALDSR